MNILYITTSLNPPNGVCAKNILWDLSQRGHKVACFTQAGDAHEAINDERIHIYYSNRSRFYNKKEKIKNEFVKKILNYVYRIWLVICYPIWPLNSILFYLQFKKQANKVVQENKIDLIITEYGDVACLIAGNYIKRKNKNIKYIAYFVDALYCGPTPKFMKKEKKEKKALYWENKLLNTADGIVMMKAAEQSYLQIKEKICYYHKIVFLDIPMLLPMEGDNQLKSTNKKGTTFLFIGSMPRNIRNPQYFLDLFLKAANADWKLVLVGTSEYVDEINRAMLQNKNICWLGKVPHSEIADVLLNSDFLINIGNSLQYMVPSKIFEYISAARPIISTYRIDEDPCIPYLLQYEHSLFIDERVCIDDNIKKLYNFVSRYKNFVIDLSDIDGLIRVGGKFYNNTPQAFSIYVEELYAK